jgi:uncharacterized protein YbjT (DUF2867 family)
MRLLSIAVLGGTGFLGTRLVARLIKDGHHVTVLSRDREQHKHLLVLPGLTLENCDVYQEAQLSERFRGKDVVINLVGILNERGFGGTGFKRAHVQLTQGVLQASRSAGVTRLLQVSALRASPDAPSFYLRTKGEAEKLIRDNATGLDWTILQPWRDQRPAFSPCTSMMWSLRCETVCTVARQVGKPTSWAVRRFTRCAKSSISWQN